MTVDLSTVSNSDHEDHENLILHAVEDAVVPGADAERPGATMEFPKACGAWVLRELVYAAGYLTLNLSREGGEFVSRRGEEFHAVTVRRVRAQGAP